MCQNPSVWSMSVKKETNGVTNRQKGIQNIIIIIMIMYYCYYYIICLRRNTSQSKWIHLMLLIHLQHNDLLNPNTI